MTTPINYNREFMNVCFRELARRQNERELNKQLAHAGVSPLQEYVSGYLRRPLRSEIEARKESGR